MHRLTQVFSRNYICRQLGKAATSWNQVVYCSLSGDVRALTILNPCMKSNNYCHGNTISSSCRYINRNSHSNNSTAAITLPLSEYPDLRTDRAEAEQQLGGSRVQQGPNVQSECAEQLVTRRLIVKVGSTLLTGDKDKNGVPVGRLASIVEQERNREEVTEMFDKFGTIEDMYIPQDRTTGQSKGIVYVTYKNASEAASAIEEMGGKTLFTKSNRPLKVVSASSKNQGPFRDPSEELEMLRLFINVPVSYTEEHIRQEFQKYGDLEYVQIVNVYRKGVKCTCAFVKFLRAYDAAVALENCLPMFRAAVAKAPKPKGPQQMGVLTRAVHQPLADETSATAGMSDYQLRQPPTRLTDVSTVRTHSTDRVAGHDVLKNYPHNGHNLIEASFPTYVKREQVNRLFDLIPGLVFFKYSQASGIAVVKYSTPQNAAFARDKLNAFEYPPGFPIVVTFKKDINNSYLSDGEAGSVDTVGVVDTLVDSLQKATTLLQQAGARTLSPNTAQSSVNRDTGVDVPYCDLRLPDRKPHALYGAKVVATLFINVYPKKFTDRILEDCFCRFGNMISAYFMPGATYGFVKYASMESAVQAISAVHGCVILGNTMSVNMSNRDKQPSPTREPVHQSRVRTTTDDDTR